MQTILPATLRAGLCGVILGAAAGAESYEAYYLFTGEFPHNEGTIYSDNFQGLTHDANNWFFSTNLTDNNHPTLFRVPVEYDLRHVRDDLPEQYPGVIRRSLHANLPHLVTLGYHHFGDISYYNGWVIVATESNATLDAMLLFRASDLQYIGRLLVPNDPPRPSWLNCMNSGNPPEARSLGWVAVDPDGFLYTSGDCVSSIYRYSIDWNNVPNQWTGTEYLEVLTYEETNQLWDEAGYPLVVGHTQGGVFSESGDLFYLLVGQIHDHDPNEGINVFNTEIWQRVRQSDNQSDPADPFDYNFDPGSPYGEEPEGITIWDLDDGRAPNIRGQLHVGKADWEIDGYDIYLDHYTNVIDTNPVTTLGWANGFAWDGARIRLQAGNYPETLVITKRVELSGSGGDVVIGAGVGP